MNKIYLFFLILFGIGYSSAKANQGDIISYEFMDNFSSDEVVELGMNITAQLASTDATLSEFFQKYFRSIVNQRNLDIYKVIYETIDFYGNTVQASGIIIIPKSEHYVCERSFSIYGHGTTFDRQGVFSRTSSWGGSEFFLPILMSANNTICVAPDYYGLGDGDGFHHHNTYKTNASSTLDLVRAGRKLCDILEVSYNNKLLPMGYSEGGTNSMGVARMIQENGLQEEFKIPLLGCGSGAYDLSGEAYEFITSNPYYPTRQYILYLLATCEDIYGNLIDEAAGETVSTYLNAPYDQLYLDNLLTQNGNVGWAPSNWTTMFQPGVINSVLTNPNHPFRTCLEKSNVFDFRNPYPTYLYYCTTDEQVPPSGALKTRDYQRSLIPWWQFWDRYKIQALDLTFGNLISDHFMCALPSIFVELFLMKSNLGLSCDYVGREAEPIKMRSMSGEQLGDEMIFSNKDFDISKMIQENDIATFEAVNLQTSRRISSSANQKLRLTENGLYLIRMERNNGEQLFNWVFKMAPDYVNTNDYDPILNNPMNQSTQIDLSLLEEEIQQIAVVDKNGHEHLVMTEGFDQAKIVLERTNSMVDGEYTVEVRTQKNTYPLLLKVDSKVQDAQVTIYPNPSSNLVTFDLGYLPKESMQVSLYDMKGSIAYSQKMIATQNFSLDVKSLAKGLYTYEISEGEKRIRGNFIKQ